MTAATEPSTHIQMNELTKQQQGSGKQVKVTLGGAMINNGWLCFYLSPVLFFSCSTMRCRRIYI